MPIQQQAGSPLLVAVRDVRAWLTARAEQVDFRVTLDDVRHRAGRQRARRAVTVSGLCVLVVLALAAPVALGLVGFRGTPAAFGVALPPREKGRHRVDKPIRTGLPGSEDGTEVVLWFERRDNGVTRLGSGEWDRTTGQVGQGRFSRSVGSSGEQPGDRSAASSGMHLPFPGAGGYYAPPGDYITLARAGGTCGRCSLGAVHR